MRAPVQHYRSEGDARLIEIGLKSISQLFNSLDPSPFHQKDLDADAEDYIVGAAREIPPHAPLKLVLFLPPDHFEQPGTADLERSIQNYFEYRRVMAARDLRYLFRLGRRSLAIGIGFLAACLTLRELAPVVLPPPFDHVAAEGLRMGCHVGLEMAGEMRGARSIRGAAPTSVNASATALIPVAN